MFRRIKKLGGTKKWMLDEPSTVVDLNQGQYSIKKKKRKEKVAFPTPPYMDTKFSSGSNSKRKEMI